MASAVAVVVVTCLENLTLNYCLGKAMFNTLRFSNSSQTN